MTFQATVYRILVASPTDVTAERKTIQEIISSWNATYFVKLKALLLPVLWELHAVQEKGGRPQIILNKQIAKDSDILIGVFWTRLGSGTGLLESGTIEVIKEFQKAGKPVMIYFSSVPVIPSSVDQKQYEILTKFMDEGLKLGLVERYDSIPDFQEKLTGKIASKMSEIHKIPEDKISREPDVAADKESYTKISKQFCDLVEGYRLDWASEKKIEPISLDDGRQILKELERDILKLRIPLAKIFNKEMFEYIDQILIKIKKLQKHRLYFDGKSYKEFWKLGDEIFTSLDVIVKKVLKEIHIQ